MISVQDNARKEQAVFKTFNKTVFFCGLDGIVANSFLVLL